MSARAPAVSVRDEQPGDRARIHAVQLAAFGQRAEADLVDALRAHERPFLSLVAVAEGQVVGHAAFSPVSLEPEGPCTDLAALGPLAVAPEHQRRGVGGALVREGLIRAVELGWRAVFLVGSPAYYRRFGFVPAAAAGFRYGDPHFDAALQAVELEPGALAGRRGRVVYPAAFYPPAPAAAD